DNRHTELAGRILVPAAVLEDHEARRHLRVVLRRRVDPVVAHGAGEDLAGPRELLDLALRHAVLRLRVGPEFVVVGGTQRRGEDGERQEREEAGLHEETPEAVGIGGSIWLRRVVRKTGTSAASGIVATPCAIGSAAGGFTVNGGRFAQLPGSRL